MIGPPLHAQASLGFSSYCGLFFQTLDGFFFRALLGLFFSPLDGLFLLRLFFVGVLHLRFAPVALGSTPSLHRRLQAPDLARGRGLRSWPDRRPLAQGVSLQFSPF